MQISSLVLFLLQKHGITFTLQTQWMVHVCACINTCGASYVSYRQYKSQHQVTL